MVLSLIFLLAVCILIITTIIIRIVKYSFHTYTIIFLFVSRSHLLSDVLLMFICLVFAKDLIVLYV